MTRVRVTGGSSAFCLVFQHNFDREAFECNGERGIIFMFLVYEK